MICIHFIIAALIYKGKTFTINSYKICLHSLSVHLFHLFRNQHFHLMSEINYRPRTLQVLHFTGITLLFIRVVKLNAAMHGMNTWGYHVVNISLHISVVISLYHLCRQVLTWDRNKSSITSLLFAIHPVHTEAVSNIVGRADILATLFFLLSILSHTRKEFVVMIGGCVLPFLFFYFGDAAFDILEGGLIVLLEDFTLFGKGPEFQIIAVINRLEAMADAFCDICSNVIFIKGTGYHFIPVFSPLRCDVRMFHFQYRKAGVLLMIRAALMGIQLPVFSQEDNPASFSSSLKTR
ncbi:Transmembrane and TPR repeat-containing protein 3 [Nymphon striatum]|nr:Transmembrane and TPR repeat-containing protein 3 [Nymphon striatum]